MKEHRLKAKMEQGVVESADKNMCNVLMERGRRIFGPPCKLSSLFSLQQLQVINNYYYYKYVLKTFIFIERNSIYFLFVSYVVQKRLAKFNIMTVCKKIFFIKTGFHSGDLSSVQKMHLT